MMPNIRAKPSVRCTGPRMDQKPTKRVLYKSTTYDIGSWRAGGDGRTLGPGWRKCTAYRQTRPSGPPLALRLSKGLGLAATW
jgi:hypothetical protein